MAPLIAANDVKAFAAMWRGGAMLLTTDAALDAAKFPMIEIIGTLDPSVAEVEPLRQAHPKIKTLVLEGALYCEEGVCRAGDFVWRPAGSRHEAWAGQEGCVALAMFQVPNRFYEPDGRVLDFLGNDWEKTWGTRDQRLETGTPSA